MEPARRWGNTDEIPSNIVPPEISGDPADHPLLPSISLDNLLRQRDAALGRIEQAIELIREALVIAQAANLGPTASEYVEALRPKTKPRRKNSTTS